VRIDLDWWDLIPLRSGRPENLIYTSEVVDDLPRAPGVYVFGYLRNGADFVPIYIGKAQRLRGRIIKQLNNTRLMLGMQKMPRVRRFLAIGEYRGRPSPLANRAIQLAERALIDYALAEGHEILNLQGTKRPRHHIHSWGSRTSRGWIPRSLSTPK
jgi:hypothetical protein